MENCKYKSFFPLDCADHCTEYSKSKRPDGKHWAHYPKCSTESCPLVHTELLEGAILEKE